MRHVISSINKDVNTIVIVDNASTNKGEIKLISATNNVTCIFNNENYGIARALNIGIEFAKKRYKPDWILLLDQDSIPQDGYSTILLNYLSYSNYELDNVCVLRGVASYILEKKSGIEDSTLYPFKTNILSGNLVRAGVFNTIRFREDFFMDFVDTDFFRNIARKDLLCLFSPAVTLEHQLGKRIHFLGKEINYEGIERMREMIRNSTILFFEAPKDFRVLIAGYTAYVTNVIKEGFIIATRYLLSGFVSAFAFVLNREK